MVLSRRAAVVATSKTTCNGITSVVIGIAVLVFFPKLMPLVCFSSKLSQKSNLLARSYTSTQKTQFSVGNSKYILFITFPKAFVEAILSLLFASL